jgi:hypothetical protein
LKNLQKKDNYIMFTIMITLIVALISPVVLAGERTVTVPTPKSITLVCSDDVEKGTVVLTNPPKFSCEDYETIKSVVGMGITIGPDTKVQEISRAIARANHKVKRKSRIASVTHKGNTSTYKMKSGNTVKWTEPVPVVSAPTTPIKVRPEGFIPIPQPKFRSDNSFGTTPFDSRDRSLRSLYSAMGVEDERSSWKTISADEYENFDGQSRNKKFFRD